MTTALNPANTYDEVPYPSGPQPLSHPCHLAMVAALFDRPAAAVDHCRVLELGCAAGGNLIPVAQDFPHSQFLGVDLSPRQVADGQSVLNALGLNNIELRQMNIADIGDDFGTFDYIICHGVYSWVPRPVQERILEIGHDRLTQQGIMYVSYNTYPGWHLRGVVRDMMRYHAASFATAEEKLGQSRSLLKFLIESPNSSSETYRQILKDEAEHLNDHSDEYIYHEHLEETNEPLYFHQFIDRISARGLRYLGDAEFARMLARQFDDATAAILQDAPLLRQEQYIDFLTARTFRRSLVCRHEGPIDRGVTPSRLRGLSVSLAEQMQVAAAGPGETTFAGPAHSVTTGHPVLLIVLRELVQVWPAWLTTDELLTRVQQSMAHAAPPDEDLLDDLLLLLSRGVLQAAVKPPAVATRPGSTPLTTPWARLQAEMGVAMITNRRHVAVNLDQPARLVLSRLDGRHDRQQLQDDLRSAFQRGELTARFAGAEVRQMEFPDWEKVLDRVLSDLAIRGLLIPGPETPRAGNVPGRELS